MVLDTFPGLHFRVMLQVVFDPFIHDTEMFLTDFYLSKSESSGINIYKNTISTQTHQYPHTHTCIAQLNTDKHLIYINDINQFGRKLGIVRLSAYYTMPL